VQRRQLTASCALQSHPRSSRSADTCVTAQRRSAEGRRLLSRHHCQRAATSQPDATAGEGSSERRHKILSFGAPLSKKRVIFDMQGTASHLILDFAPGRHSPEPGPDGLLAGYSPSAATSTSLSNPGNMGAGRWLRRASQAPGFWDVLESNHKVSPPGPKVLVDWKDSLTGRLVFSCLRLPSTRPSRPSPSARASPCRVTSTR